MDKKPPLSSANLEQKQRDLQQLLDKMADKFKGPAGQCKITDQEFSGLRQYIYDKSGIYIPSTRRYLLENRLAPRLRELSLESFNQYLNHLQRMFGPQGEQEFSRLMELVTTNETSFYRNTAQLSIFQDTLLQELLDRKRAARDYTLHIWSAGCSTGEEPYTLSIILHEALGAEMQRWRFSITASDISEAVLQAAKEGRYTDYSLRSTPKTILTRYFKQENGSHLVDPEDQKASQVGKLNLSDDMQIRRVERADIVFCRNVIIYFDQEMKRKVIKAFYDKLAPSGYLFIGHSETLHSINDEFKALNYPGAMVYQKPGGGTT